tara:strand:+ start:143 stop:397 length:255 start_codon:yes stop_codon:yes gene_type:complete
MSEEKVLTKEIAEQFIADPVLGGLDQYTVIVDAAAESLSRHKGETVEDALCLESLTELSEAAAKSLAKKWIPKPPWFQSKINFS